MKTPSSRRVHRRPDVSIAVQKFHWLTSKTPTTSVGDGVGDGIAV